MTKKKTRSRTISGQNLLLKKLKIVQLNNINCIHIFTTNYYKI